MTDKTLRQRNNAARKSAGIHDFAGQNKQRHSDHGKVVDRVQDVLCDDLAIEKSHLPHQGSPRDDQCVSDRPTQSDNSEKRSGKYGECHLSAPSAISRSASSSSSPWAMIRSDRESLPRPSAISWFARKTALNAEKKTPAA